MTFSGLENIFHLIFSLFLFDYESHIFMCINKNILNHSQVKFCLNTGMKRCLNYERWKDQNSGGQDCRAHPVCLSQIRSLPSIYLCSCHQSYPTTCIFLKEHAHTHTHTMENIFLTLFLPLLFSGSPLIYKKWCRISIYR